MVRIIGRIYKMSTRTVSVNRFFYERFLEGKTPYDHFRTPEENFSLCFGPMLTLNFSSEIVDTLISNTGEICEFEIKNGVVRSVKPFKTREQILKEFEEKWKHEEKLEIDMIMTGKPKSLRDKLRIILATLAEMEKETGMASESDLLEKLEKEFEINPREAKALLKQLLREGSVFLPRKGYWKST